MTGVALFVVVAVGIGLAAGYLGLTDGSIPVNIGLVLGVAFVVGVLFVLGGIFSRDHNKARRINGEIEAKLQSFVNQRIQAYGNPNYWDVVDKANLEEDEFRTTIEYGVVTDGSENYWSYKK